MLWQVARRSVLSVLFLGAFMACCFLLCLALPGAAFFFAVFGACGAFGAVMILIGWIFQEQQPTEPPRTPPRRLSVVRREDRFARTPPTTRDLREAA